MSALITFCLSLSFFCQQDPSFADNFSWLTGTWEMDKGKTKRLEIWAKKDDATLHGSGLKLSGKDTILLERIELISRENQIFYIPTVPDQNNSLPVPFKLVQSENNSFVFENPEHDFPQRISYHFKPLTYTKPCVPMEGDTLLVRVESLNGNGISFDFYRK